MALPGWAKDYVGIPFKEFGRTREGLDCYGLVLVIFREQFGIDLPSYVQTYASSFDGKTVGASAKKNFVEASEWKDVVPGKEELGDLLLCHGYYVVHGMWRKAAMHVGLVLERGTMIHIEHRIDASLARYRDRQWQRRLIGFYRHESMRVSV